MGGKGKSQADQWGGKKQPCLIDTFQVSEAVSKVKAGQFIDKKWFPYFFGSFFFYFSRKF